jgi:signal transduction histidine kinase
MRRIRLRTLLLLINLLILALPLAGIWFLRLYESALIRQTEAELVAQAAMLAGAYKIERQILVDAGNLPPEPETGAGAAPLLPDAPANRTTWLDLAEDPVLPPAPDPVSSATPALALAAAVGAAVTPVLREAQPVTLAAMRIVDRRGIVTATTGDDLGASLAGLDEIRRALAGEPVSTLRRYGETPPGLTGGFTLRAALRVYVASPVLVDGRVVAAILLSRTPRDLAHAIYGRRLDIAVMTALLLATGLFLALAVSRLVTRPLGLVVAQAQRAAAGETGIVTPLARPGPRELAELSEAVTRMAAILERRADYIRSFAAHVSHEFKTPLAGAKGALELLEDHGAGMDESERRHFISVVGASLDRLDLLVRRLVDLARADMMRQGRAAPRPIAASLEALAIRYRARGLTVRITPTTAQTVLTDDALEMMLGSLLDNVLRHAGSGAAAAITAEQAADRLALIVTDDGPGVPAADAARIFEPFFTTARAQGGTGLGLPIVRAIAAALGGTVELMSGAGRGAAFEIRLPNPPTA